MKEEAGYSNIYFLIGFVESSDDFDKAIENYTVYGKSKWDDYDGEFYAYIYVANSNLSFDEFKKCIVKVTGNREIE